MESMAARPETALALIARTGAFAAETQRLVREAAAGAPYPESLAVALSIAGEGLMEIAAALRRMEATADAFRLARAAGKAEGGAEGWAEGWAEGYRAGWAACQESRRGHLALVPAS